MARVELHGWIPVTVTVDTDTQEVVKVNAWDEEFTYGDPAHRPEDVVEWEPSTPLEAEAHAIANGAAWPAWTWGC